MSLGDELKEAMKVAMKAKDKERLGTIRMAIAAVRQIEIDERITLDDDGVLKVLVKMIKQRKDAIVQYTDANRPELADKEAAEIKVIESFLPQPLTEQEIADLIDKAVTELNASGMQDMGKVIGVLKPQMQGKADMAAVSGLIKARLTA
ncbi:MAG: GatB/YqeY domain-containing protein [Psychrosphaera sp.]|nr:GatB/YqeY domain-containing protein [Psychrosphaera sp.]